MCPFETTEDGNELQMQTNHYGHFLLTNSLLSIIKSSAPARIINVSSMGHQFGKNLILIITFINGLILYFFLSIMTIAKQMNYEITKENYNSRIVYGQSKLANIFFTQELAKKLQGKMNTI